MASRFAISDIVSSVGESVQIVSGTSVFNTRGDISGASYSYFNSNAVVQVMSASDEGVQEGILKPEDIIAYFDYDDSTSVSGALTIGSTISGAFLDSTSRSYKIKNVVRNPGHYEVHANKL